MQKKYSHTYTPRVVSDLIPLFTKNVWENRHSFIIALFFFLLYFFIMNLLRNTEKADG